ncbi:MAG TPA: 2,3-epoxybenzoyl-CoA dihydrolase [Vicinamibacteria bacterium]|nr:2,3-epoxybenzoyl-CoA dihydrolase [Vicinamibacteria bacterium]
MKPISFEAHPSDYRHWRLSTDGPVATLALDVREDAGLVPGYQLKLNSYDLSVDIELADAVERLRFEHPEVRTVVITSAKDRVFSAGANIYMLGSSSHSFKVNFCKFTNETRLAIEEASRESGQTYLAALNGIASGGGYELALAADEILLVDDGNAAVALPEAPLLAVLPGTGGLTRLVDKRMVRRDRADVFSTLVEGIKGKRAREWKLVDEIAPRSKFDELVRQRAEARAASSARRADGPGITLAPLEAERSETSIDYRTVRVRIRPEARTAAIEVRGPEGPLPATPEAIRESGASFWPLAVARELDDALLHLRFHHETIGLLLIRTVGDAEAVLAYDRLLHEHASHWLVKEVLLKLRRTFKRLDQTARSVFALIEPGSCFVGSLLELALAADRSYMLDDPSKEIPLGLGPLNDRWFPMANGLTRLETRFWGDPDGLASARTAEAPIGAEEALDLGLVTFAPDELDWDDELRIACEERAGFSPDAMTGMEASLRFAGPETMETKIFGRLSAWQNWIFQRPNAVGEKGALTLYGKQSLPEFDWRRT